MKDQRLQTPGRALPGDMLRILCPGPALRITAGDWRSCSNLSPRAQVSLSPKVNL